MANRGRMKYCPPIVLEELESIKGDLGISKDVSAFEKLTKYARVGREAERIKNLDFIFRNRGRKK